MMTTTTVAPPSAWDTLEAALRQRRPVQLSYHGRPRTVCPHALGWKNNKPMLLAYQTDGHTSAQDLPADPRKQWRNLFVDEIRDPVFADPAAAWETADNYNTSHPFNAIDHLAIAITQPPHTTV
ncbi:MAG: WYL domain-containing protein [Actinomycetota bacterium]|nr:WYL domain-containing protein [Actinomycetota bacterium]